ncbi:MAG: porin, partial [Pseudomonadota bacterium]
MKLKCLAGAILASLLIVLSTPAMASNKALLELFKILHEKGSITTEEYNLLRNTAAAEGQQLETELSEIKVNLSKKPEQTSDSPSINTKGKLEIKSADGEHKFRIGGRLQYDSTFVSTDGNYTDDNGSSETQFRRARVYLSGTFAKDWDFKFQYDFEDTQDSDQAIEDAYIRYTGWPADITLGQRKAPYSMNELTSSKYIAFIERSFVSELFNNASLGVGNRNMGVTMTRKHGNFLLEGGYYALRTPGGGEVDFDDGHGFTGRAVWADYDKSARTLLHVGISGGLRKYANGSVSRFRVRPNVSEGARLIDSDGALAADQYHAMNLNVAAMYQRFWANAEYFRGSFDLAQRALGDDDMDGLILQGGIFLTDDSRRYKNGAWDSVKVKTPFGEKGWGAWEVAFRYDQAKIGASLHRGADAEEASAFTAALNFYPINNVRLQANYIRTFCDNTEICAKRTASPAVPDAPETTSPRRIG